VRGRRNIHQPTTKPITRAMTRRMRFRSTTVIMGQAILGYVRLYR
jgi:hypothetical protein